MNKKKICFIAQFPPPMHGLSKAVEILYNSELQDEFEIEKIDITNNKKIFKNLKLISKSQAELFYFTISQTKYGNIRDLIILKFLELQHKKCLIHLHGGYYRKLVENDMSSWQRRANYKAISKLSGAIVLGKSLKYIFEGMLPDDKIFIVPNCVDDEYLMCELEFEEKIRLLPEKKVKHVLYLSNFIRSKGYMEVLELAKFEKERCSAENRKLHFDFAGKFFKATEKKIFFNYIKKNNLEDYVTYHGIVNGDKKRELLKNCDIYTLFTRYPNEGQPISILEAMGNGLMIFTTDYAGIPDIVDNGINGIMIKVDGINIHNLYETIKDLGPVTDLLRNAYRKIRQEFLEKTYLDNMRKIFRYL